MLTGIAAAGCGAGQLEQPMEVFNVSRWYPEIFTAWTNQRRVGVTVAVGPASTVSVTASPGSPANCQRHYRAPLPRRWDINTRASPQSNRLRTGAAAAQASPGGRNGSSHKRCATLRAKGPVCEMYHPTPLPVTAFKPYFVPQTFHFNTKASL